MRLLKVVFGSVVLLASSCTLQNHQLLSDGFLVYANGWGIRQLNIRSGELSTLYGREGITAGSFAQNSLSKVDGTRFLFDIDQLGNKQEIRIYDRHSSSSRFLREGMRPVFLENQNKFLFLYNDPLLIPRYWRLYIADLSSPIDSARMIIDAPFRRDHGIFSIGNDEILFELDKELVRYNTTKSSYIHMNRDRGCNPLLWRSATRALLCWDGSSSDYYWMSLDEAEDVPAFGKDGFYGYLPDHDLIVDTGSRFSWWNFAEVSDIRVYSAKENRGELVKEREFALGGTVLWFEN